MTVYYQRGSCTFGSLIVLRCEDKNGNTITKRRYIDYSLREAFKRIKKAVGIKRAKLVKVDWLI